MQHTSTQGPQQRGRSSSDQAEPSGKEGDSFRGMRSPFKALKASVFLGPAIGQAPNWLSGIAADELEAQAGDVSCLTNCVGVGLFSDHVPPLRSTVAMAPSWNCGSARKQEAMLHCSGAEGPERTRRFEAWSKDLNFRAVLDPLHVARASLISCLPWKPLSSRVLKSVSARTALSASWLHSARVV